VALERFHDFFVAGSLASLLRARELHVFGDTISDAAQRVLAATIVLTLLTSALLVILCRTAPAAGPAPAHVRPTDLAAEITAVAAGLDALPPSPELRSAAARLRELAEHAAARH
jgi:hypothetical protein